MKLLTHIYYLFDLEQKKNAGNVVTVHHMPHVGHWLHAEDLNGVLTTITGHSKPVGERLI